MSNPLKDLLNKMLTPEQKAELKAHVEKFNVAAPVTAPVVQEPVKMGGETKLVDGTVVKYDTPTLAVGSVVTIVTPDGEVTDQLFIKEFIDNADKDFFSTIMEHLEKQKDQFSIEPFEIVTTLEDRELGAPEKFTVPITLDTSNFFG